ncbi:MAG: zinc ribbon domain-containing protein [Armatimonadetes bacterium]|jgi:putative FmdB family regulatory protein|nr:zinc ribbon domain-containing protein [Armatimonadota bacterium]
MPTYEYLCQACQEQFEVFQRVTEPPVTTCRLCGGGPVRKLISRVGVIFKGPGFHVNDYRKPDARRDADEKASTTSSTTKSDSTATATAGAN